MELQILLFFTFLMLCDALLRSLDSHHLAFSVFGIEEVHPLRLGYFIGIVIHKLVVIEDL